MKIRSLVLLSVLTGIGWIGYARSVAAQTGAAQKTLLAQRPSPTRGTDPVETIDLAARRMTRLLAQPMTMVVQGQTVGSVISELAAARNLNVWAERDLDRGGDLSTVRLGPTVWDSLNRLAESAGAEIVPAGEVVLIGRPEWLDRNLAALRQCCSSERSAPATDAEVISVAWPDLVTPSEVLRLCQRAGTVEPAELADEDIAGMPAVDDDLPHDLWPAAKIDRVPRSVVSTLIAVQASGETDSRGSAGSVWTARYPTTFSSRVLAEAVGKADPQARVRGIRLPGNLGAVEISGGPASHRIATGAILRQLAGNGGVAVGGNPAGKAGTDPDATFDLKLLNQPAGKMIQTFAANAGMACDIRDQARAAAETLVSLEAKGQTLEQLSRTVARRAGLAIAWGPEKVVVSLP